MDNFWEEKLQDYVLTFFIINILLHSAILLLVQ